MESTILAKIAGTQPSTVTPGTIAETINSMIAFTINVKRPKVTNVNGAVKKPKTGLIKVLTTPKTIAAKTAVVKLSTLNPGTM